MLSLMVKTVSHVNGRALNSQLFKLLCDVFGANHRVLFFHTNVRWISRRNVTKRVQELSRELMGFFQQSNKCENFVTSLRDPSFVLSLAHFVDIFKCFEFAKPESSRKTGNRVRVYSKNQSPSCKTSLWRGNIQCDS